MKKIFLFLLISSTYLGFGEGSKELGDYTVIPIGNGSAIGGLILADPNDPTFSKFGQYGAPSAYQIKIRVSAVSEKINWGMQMRDNTNARALVTNVAYRILDPNGNIVFTSTTPTANTAGYIANFAQAVAGPNVGGVTNGYNPLTYQPTMTGDYVIEFDPLFAAAGQTILNIPYFDVTVTNGANRPILGRLHSQAWQLSNGSYTINPIKASVYPYHPNGVVYKVSFNDMKPFVFSIFFNSTGTDSTGFVRLDRQSQVGYSQFPQYEVFLNPPDPNLYPTYEQNIKYKASITKSDCESSLFCIAFESENIGVVEGFIDFNGNSVLEPTLGDIAFADLVDSTGATCIEWDGKDGQGNAVDSKDIQIISKFGSGTMHFPLYDIEHNPGGYRVETYLPNSLPDPLIYWDDRLITTGTIPATSTLTNFSGCSSSAGIQSCHQWTNRGQIGGTRALQETINTWWYAEIKYDTLNFTYTPNYPVNISFAPESIIRDYPKICAGDSVNFYVYNNKINHYDTTRYKYYWFANGNFQDTLTFDKNTLNYKAFDETLVHLFAEFRLNKECTSHDSILVRTVTPIKANILIDSMACTEVITTAQVTLLDSGGQENPVIRWVEFPQLNAYTNTNILANTLYTFTIADDQYNARCAFDTNFSVVGSRTIDIKEIFGDSTICYESTGDISVEMQNSNASYSYSWEGGSFQPVNQLNNVKAGEYTVIIRDDSTLCVVDTIIPVTPLPFKISGSTTPEICENGTGTATVEIPSTNLNIKWEDSSTALVLNNLSVGMYSVLVFSDLVPNCQAQDSFLVLNENLIFEIDSLKSTPSKCYDSTGTAEVVMKTYTNVQFVYSWNQAPFQNAPFKNVLPSNTYTVEIIDNISGCKTDTIVFVPIVPFEIDGSTLPELCNDAKGSATVQIPSNLLSVSWSKGSLNTLTIPNLTAGIYTATVFSNLSANCTETIDLEVINENLVFEVDSTIAEATLCYDSTGRAEVIMKTYPNTQFAYAWDGENFENISKKENLLSKTYSIVILDQISGCSTATSIPVPSKPFDIQSLARPELCANAKGSIEVELPSNKIILEWTDATLTNVLRRTDLSSGIYSFRAYSELNLGSDCEVVGSQEVTNEIHEVKIKDTYTENASCALPTGVGEIILDSMPIDRNYVIQWEDLGDEFTEDFRREGLSPQTYTAVVYEEGTNCKSDTILIIIPKGFDIALSSENTICSANIGAISIQITEGDTAEYGIVWNDNASVAYTRTDLDSGFYSFRIVSENDPTCRVDSTIQITHSENTLTASFDIQYDRPLNEVFLNDSLLFINTSSEATPIVKWVFTEGSEASGNTVGHAFTSMGDKEAYLYIEDQWGCNASAKRPMTVLEYKTCGLAMPNAFTPNNDGINDKIGVLGFADDIELRIYNRWGEMLYRSFDFKDRWNGSFKGGESPIDTYVYQLEYICRSLNGKESKEYVMGEITLIR